MDATTRTLPVEATHGAFVRVPPGEWSLSDGLAPRRRKQLQDGLAYEQIVARMVRESALVRVKREKARGESLFFRTVVTLRVLAATLDLFHNSACGYRAQYYRSAELGIQANKFALHQLLPRVRQLLVGSSKRTCPIAWVEKSLLDADAKVWIHQGIWLRRARKTDCNLFVARWISQQAHSDEKRRKRAIRSMLTPSNETLVELKGGFIMLTGMPLGSRKPTRAQDIHELGFT